MSFAQQPSPTSQFATDGGNELLEPVGDATETMLKRLPHAYTLELAEITVAIKKSSNNWNDKSIRNMEHIKHPELRREIGFLGTILGETIRELSGEPAFNLVEELRRLAWDRRTGVENSDRRMAERISSLDAEELGVTMRAFTVFLDLLNLVEDRQRLRVLGDRERATYPEPSRESIRNIILELKNSEKSPEEIQSLLDEGCMTGFVRIR